MQPLSFGVVVALTAFAAFGKTCWKDLEAPGAASRVTELKDGTKVRVDALAENLFRVRRSRDGVWTESGMNRYGVLKRDWPEAKAEWKVEGGFRTPSAAVTVGTDGTVAMKSSVSAADLAIVTKLTEKGGEVTFPLAKGERVYGLGDVSRENIQRRPGRYEMWVKNINSYIPIPMALAHSGWGMLLNTTWRNFFDVGVKNPDALVCEIPEGELDFYVFAGRDYRALLGIYTRLSGRPALLPAFGYGFSFVCNQNVNEFALMQDALNFRDRGFPCDVIGLEPGWMSKFYDMSTRKWWNNEKFHFPYWAPKGSHTWIAALNRLGFKLSLWLCVDYDLYRYEEQCVAGEAKKFGRQVEIAGDVTETWEDDRVGNPEFAKSENARYMSNVAKKLPFREREVPEGMSPWFEHLKKFVDQGVQCFKLDCSNQGAEHPTRKWANGMTDEEAHNLYPLVYDKQMARGFEEYTGKRSMVYSACGYAGVQQFVATWAGDTGGGVKPCASLLNLAMSGHSNQSCDMSISDAKSLHFGFLQTWSQQNNWDYWKQPWFEPPEKQTAVRKYANLRYRLFPYLYGAAAEASRTGWPVMRALPLVYPDEPKYDACRTTYLLGDSLLVGAFTDAVEVPEGTWYDWDTGAEVVGPATVPFAPRDDWGGALYVKAGAIVPTWPARPYVKGGWSNEIVFEVWPSADGTAELYEDDGLTLNYRAGAYALVPLSVKRDGKKATFTVGRRHGTEKATFVTPGAPDYKVAFHVAGRPSSVRVNGERFDGTFDETSRTFTVSLGAVPVDGCTVEIAD